MKKFISFVLAFVMIIGTVASAAPGDIIHTELGKIYRANNDEDQKQLVKDALNKDIDNNYFFKEVENKKFVNILDEEKKQLDFLNTKIKDLGDDFDKTNPEAINKLILDHINALENIMTGDELKVLSELDTSITEENYFGDSKLPKLVLGENYSNPVPGSADNTTQIINLTLPRGSSSWVYKIGKENFVNLEIGDTVEDTKDYRSGRNINVDEGDYLFLGAIDGAGQLKAYASIEIADGMIQKPKVEATKIDTFTFTKGSIKNGSIIISSTKTSESWKTIILDKNIDIVYQSDVFSGTEYTIDNELVVATDNELDDLTNFKKYILIYNEVDEKINEYAVLEVKGSDIFVKPDTAADTFEIKPTKGSIESTTKVEELSLKEIEDATQWMYILSKSNELEIFEDKKYEDSKIYNLGNNIKAEIGDTLYILATDENDRVKKYGKIQLDKSMIQDPPAMLLQKETHYRDIKKGDNVGETKITVHTSPSLDKLLGDKKLEWKYILSKDRPSIPKLDSDVPTGADELNNTIKLDKENRNLIKSEDPFSRNLLLLATDGNKVKGYAIIALDRKNIHYPKADELKKIDGNNGHYSKPESGSQPGTTKISTLNISGFESHRAWHYALVDEALTIDYKQPLRDFSGFKGPYSPGSNITVKDEKYIVLVSVDANGKILAYANIKLGNDDVTAGYATDLKPTTDYEGPIAGQEPNSTRFTKFHGPTDNEWFYKKVTRSGDKIISGTEIKDGDGFNSIGVDEDIKGVKVNDWILLVRTDKTENGINKINGFAYIQLKNDNIRGGKLQDLKSDVNFKLEKGSRPGTTKITDLNLGGIEGSPHSNWKWMYKVIATSSEDKYIPYFDENIRNFAIEYKPGDDIDVTKDDSILLFATDRNFLAKAYAEIGLDVGVIQGSAPGIENAEIEKGTTMDSVKVRGLPNNSKYKALITKEKPKAYSVGDSLPEKAVDYVAGNNISVLVGEFLTIYQVDENNKIITATTFEVKEVAQGAAELKIDSENYFLEGNIVKGGSSFEIQLTNATWVDDIKTNKSVRDKLFNGFKADSETGEWAKVIGSMIADGGGVISLKNDTTLTILLPETTDYDITKDQNISLTIPFEAIQGALNPLVIDDKITIKPTVGARISGDVVNGIIREDDILAGDKTIIIELIDGEWATDVSKIISQFSSSAGENSNWNKIVSSFDVNAKNGDIRRNSSSKVTITLPKVSKDKLNFNGKSEVISLEIKHDSDLITNATENVVASPDFTLYPNRIPVEGEPIENTITLEAPDYRVIAKDKDTWTIEVTRGTLKDNNIDIKDLLIKGLPRGLAATVSKVESDDKNLIEIKLTGTASSTLANDTTVKVKIKGSAVTEPNSIDSEDIELKLVRGASNKELLEKVKINVVGEKLLNTTFNDTSKMEYSLNSTNGTTNGNWYYADDGTDTDVSLTGGFKAGRVYVRDKNNPKVFHLVATLSHPKAPTGVNVSNVDYTEANTMKVTLDLPTGIDYDYSLDGGKDWIKNYLTSDTIPLGKGSDLRVRYRATEGSLESLATSKINILDLSEVNIDVAKDMIAGTTNTMEYSLSGGIEGTFSTARATETPVEFKNGSKVVVRQRSMIGNQRSIGEEIKPVPRPTSPTDVDFNISVGATGTITANNPNLQYRIGTDPWKDLSSGKNSVIFKPGKLEVRAKGTDAQLPSEPVELQDIKAPASAPDLKIDDFKKTIEYRDGDGWKNLTESSLLEFQVNNGEWKIGSQWNKSLLTNTTDNVGVRYKATKNTLPSLIKVVNFTGNLTFEDVELNVAEGRIEGTTTAMQYGTSLTNGSNITWIDAKAGNTPVQFIKGMRVYIREKSKHENSKELTDENGITVGEAIVVSNIDYDISAKIIENKLDRVLEYRFNNEQAWNIISRGIGSTVADVEFKAGKLEFRAKATEKTLPSPSISIDIKAKASAPSLSYNDVTHEIENIGDSNGSKYEYSINGGTWTPDTTPTQFEGRDIVNIRLVADKETLPSQEQTIKFTPNLDLNNVILNAGKSQLENTSNLMQYMTKSNDGEDGTWTSITKTPTELKLQADMVVYVREKAKPGNSRLVTENPIGEKDPIDKSILDKIDYNILQSTISITSTDLDDQKIINDLQYRVNNGNWVNIDYVKLDKTTSKVLAYNVNFLEGNLEFRLKGDESTLPSDSVLKGTIKSPASAPNVSKGFDTVNYRNKVNEDTSLMEYRFGDSGPWIDGTHLGDENLVGTVYIRKKAGNHSLPSLAKKLEFTPVLNLKIINLSTHVDPHELNGTTKQMEYQIYLKDGKPPTGWITCDDDNTVMPTWLKTSMAVDGSFEKLEIRDKNQHANTVTITREP